MSFVSYLITINESRKTKNKKYARVEDVRTEAERNRRKKRWPARVKKKTSASSRRRARQVLATIRTLATC